MQQSRRVLAEKLRLLETCRQHWQRLLQQFDDIDNLRQRLDYQTYILAAATLTASLVLGIADLATSGAIEKRQAEDMQSTLSQVLPDTLHDNDLLNSVATVGTGEPGDPATSVYIARKSGSASGAAFKWSAGGGYSGPILLMVGVDRDGRLQGVRVVAHAETPGLGDKIERSKSDWILAFDGRSLDDTAPEHWKVKKDGGDFDQFAGATITPRAVVRGVESALQFYRRHREEILAAKPGGG
ncbi:MAG: electron transport complex subunit RsxG [Methylococcaceae bacterium]|nr:MAG: electron transport complex subunit RsxG [Methylococcaceae bacterium]